MELNEQQREAVTYAGTARNILVNAGAGCGKTRTIIARASHLVREGTDSSRILIMTFTNRAAREIKQRLKSEIGEASTQMQAGTFHSFCLKVMTRIPKSFEIQGLAIIDTDDQVSLMGSLRKQYISSHPENKKGFPKPNVLLNLYSYSRNTCITPQSYLREQCDYSPEIQQGAIELFESYKEAKAQRGYVDYDDLLEIFADMLEAKEPLKRAVCSLFDEVLVDEMQDTNPLQFRILKHFSSVGTRLFCVGDPAQSIYRFRGAEFKHIYEFEKNFGNSITFALSLNYRSYQEILDMASWLLSGSSYEYPNRLIASKESSGFLPRIEEFEHSSQEADWIADYIVSAAERGIPLRDIMVLYRTAFEAKGLEAELIRRDIPYRFIGGTVLTKSAHVRDVLSLLRVVRNERDDLAWMRYLQLWPRIGERSAERILSAIEGSDQESPAAVLLQQLGTDHPAARSYIDASERFSNPTKCLKTIRSSLNDILKERYDNWKQRSKDLELLVQVAQNYSSTEQFIDDFTLEPLNDTQISKDHTDDALTLITVHSAKGTESPVCIVASASQSQYPHFRSLGDLEAEEEERRVLYVALTRAMNELIITRSSFLRNAFWVESSPAVGQAYFLEEVPQEVATITLHGWSPDNPAGLGSLQDIF